jgi:hypothetical protein
MTECREYRAHSGKPAIAREVEPDEMEREREKMKYILMMNTRKAGQGVPQLARERLAGTQLHLGRI